jgi:hypothetical protein
MGSLLYSVIQNFIMEDFEDRALAQAAHKLAVLVSLYV